MYGAMAFHRVNALNEIENMATFNLPPEMMRKEIKRIAERCRLNIQIDRKTNTPTPKD